MESVYIIEDEKYGIKDIFSSEKLAEAAFEAYPNKYDGCCVIEYDLVTQPESEKVIQMLNKLERKKK